MRKVYPILAVSFVVIGLSPFALSSVVPRNGSESMQSKMDKAFHYYAMVCSVSPWNPTDAKKKPNNGGHELMFLKGACRDQNADLPTVKMCEIQDESELDDGNLGVALSVDKILYNTHFLVTEGRDLMFNGALNPGEAISDEWKTRTVNAVVATGELKNIVIHPENVSLPYQYKLGDKMVRYMGDDGKEDPARSVPVEQYIARVATDTDYGILGAREAQCATVPMTRSQVEAIVVAANLYNKPYTSGKKINDWNGANKNCSSFVRNMMAAAKVRTHFAEWNGGGFLGRMFFKMLNTLTLRASIPKNDSLKTAEMANQIEKIGSAEQAFADKKSRETFNQLGTLPTMGAVLQVYPMIEDEEGKGNALYVHRTDTLFKDIPILRPRNKLLNEYANDPDYNTVTANLFSVLTQLQEVQANRVSADESNPEFKEFADRYHKWIDESIIGTKQKLFILGQ